LAKYKIKTHSGAKRRFYVTGSGKLLMRKCHVNHMRRKKTGATLRLLSGKLAVSKHNVKRIRKLLPYAG
jgi:large subunit ribosomal protein L35